MLQLVFHHVLHNCNIYLYIANVNFEFRRTINSYNKTQAAIDECRWYVGTNGGKNKMQLC